MANLSSLRVRIQLEALGATPALIDLKVRDAARMFMRETPSYRADHADVPIVPQQAEYTLTMPTDAELVRVLYVDFLSTGATRARPLFPVAEKMLHRHARLIEGGIKHYTTPKLGILELVPIPSINVSGTLTGIVMQLRPSRTSVTIDDDVLDRWEEEIMVGAQWLMYDVQDQPWTNKAEARRYKLRFVKSWTDARRELGKGFTQSDLRVKIPVL